MPHSLKLIIKCRLYDKKWLLILRNRLFQKNLQICHLGPNPLRKSVLAGDRFGDRVTDFYQKACKIDFFLVTLRHKIAKLLRLGK